MGKKTIAKPEHQATNDFVYSTPVWTFFSVNSIHAKSRRFNPNATEITTFKILCSPNGLSNFIRRLDNQCMPVHFDCEQNERRKKNTFWVHWLHMRSIEKLINQRMHPTASRTRSSGIYNTFGTIHVVQHPNVNITTRLTPNTNYIVRIAPARLLTSGHRQLCAKYINT